MDPYQRVEKPRAESPIAENEIRITGQGRMRNYITYAMNLLQGGQAYVYLACMSVQEIVFCFFVRLSATGSDDIVFKAMGRAISKTVTIVGLIKRRIVGLHQLTSIGSTDITDTWEPPEEGLLP
uniref:DNA/RNA-binding protein Alba-like domain-containing protein n=1 Tax=Kalanchoe fedtschenkoi TaxID=63787 RepID=A0A7N0SZZ5_KALFE